MEIPNEGTRFEIDIRVLRQYIWKINGEPLGELQSDWPDRCRWIDTSCTLADLLTKSMRADGLEEFLESGILNLQLAMESFNAKLTKEAARKKKTDD